MGLQFWIWKKKLTSKNSKNSVTIWVSLIGKQTQLVDSKIWWKLLRSVKRFYGIIFHNINLSWKNNHQTMIWITYTVSMISQLKTLRKDPEKYLQLRRCLSKAFHLERPLKSCEDPFGSFQGVFHCDIIDFII